MGRKASTIRAKQGRYVPNGAAARTKPTTGYVGPREPGIHGKTERRAPSMGSQNWFESFMKGLRSVKPGNDHDGGIAADVNPKVEK